MHLGAQFPALQSKNESIHFGVSALSEGIHSAYLPGTCANIPTKKSVASSRHHVKMSGII